MLIKNRLNPFRIQNESRFVFSRRKIRTIPSGGCIKIFLIDRLRENVSNGKVNGVVVFV